jgi:hypothetical protein
MRSQLLSDGHARLNLPRSVTPPARLTLPARAEAAARSSGTGTRRASRRTWLTGLTGGALSPLGGYQPPRHQDPVLTLVHRITQGFSLAEYEHAQALGFQGYLEEQLDHLSIDDSAMDALLPRFPVIDMSPKEVFDTYAGTTNEAYRELKSAMVSRATGSKRQLFERMCEFWSDHFNIDHNKGLEWALLPEHERTVIRPHALGSFPAMLSACAFGGAMLYYLDNWLNVRSAPQENYARELLELHTLSVHGGYNESDVDEVAKCFTGWTLNGDQNSPDWLRGVYDPALHRGGQKFVLGHVIPSAPPVGRPGQAVDRNDAERVLEILSMHPSTATFLAQKLIRRFLTPTPPQDLVAEVASTYLSTQGDIRAMLRVILTRENLAFHSARLAPKYRRPFHLLVSLIRAMDGSVRHRINGTLGQLAAMGQSPYDFGPPTGYPEDFPAWGGSLLPRWNFLATILRHDFIFAGVVLIQPAALRTKLEIQGPADRPGLAERMNARLFGHSLSAQEVEILQQYIDGYPETFDLYALYDCLVLAASLPGFQWH